MWRPRKLPDANIGQTVLVLRYLLNSVVDVGISGPEFFDSRFAAGKTPWDFGGVPNSLRLFLEKHHGPGRVLIPGCGSGYEIEAFASTHWEVMGVDFSTVAVARARQLLGPLGDHVHQGDFFAYPLRQGWFDIIYERTFLCTLTPEFRTQYARRIAELVAPSGLLCVFFFSVLKTSLRPIRFLKTNCMSCSELGLTRSRTRRWKILCHSLPEKNDGKSGNVNSGSSAC